MSLLTIDLSDYLSGTNTLEQDKDLAAELRNAYETIGFAYITGWQCLVAPELIKKVFQYNEQFFDLPQATKDNSNRGYLSFGREQASLSAEPSKIATEREIANDQKETFEIGNDSDPLYPEHWPNENDIPGFKETMNTFHVACHELHLRMMALLALSLNLDIDFFLHVVMPSGEPMVFCHSRLGAHTDFGTVTLLWQDMCGRLQVSGPDGSWVDVKPNPGSEVFVVNLTRRSNNLLKSTVHHAVLPLKPGQDPLKTPTRRSVAYFCNPDPEAMIECIPGLGESLYEKINAGEYYAQALKGEIGV
ncbi:oxidoreductase [Desarmillaria tabescens]|uniref:Oxidoreductase n=1 Tax=Armillaria tabescens TaxID=1929756 RepID=A0AA39NKK8_ARMTA|nr:oxidoreductase [Desarmillaria tabescens]KAK0467312.1 oxidoreductase [Desarmillaria tabescens]